MKKAIFTILLLIPVLAFSQKVKKEIDKSDPYTNSHIRETNFTVLATTFTKTIRVKARSFDGKPQLFFRLTLHSPFLLAIDSYISILLENDKVVKLRCMSGDASNYDSGSGVSYWWCDAIYELSPEDIDLLKAYSVKGIRMSINNSEYVQFDKIKGKNKEDIKKCLDEV